MIDDTGSGATVRWHWHQQPTIHMLSEWRVRKERELNTSKRYVNGDPGVRKVVPGAPADPEARGVLQFVSKPTKHLLGLQQRSACLHRAGCRQRNFMYAAPARISPRPQADAVAIRPPASTTAVGGCTTRSSVRGQTFED